MKKIQYASDFHRIKSLIDDSKSGGHEICLWQKDQVTQKRIIHNMKVDKNIFSEKKIWMQATHGSVLNFIQDIAFYYCHELQIVFKTEVVSKEDHLVCLSYPEEVMLIEEEDTFMDEFANMKPDAINEDFTWVKSKKTVAADETTIVKGPKEELGNDMMRVGGEKDLVDDELIKVKGFASEKEAEKLFAAQRESARLAPKDEKHVTLVRASHPAEQDDYKLFDLSQGGAGLLIFSLTKFKIGEDVSIIAIDKKPIDKALVGKVVAIRPYDEGKGEYKLGIKFS